MEKDVIKEASRKTRKVDFKNLKSCHGEEKFSFLSIGFICRTGDNFRNKTGTNYSPLRDMIAGRMFQDGRGHLRRWFFKTEGEAKACGPALTHIPDRSSNTLFFQM